jgi:hypothetical protein
MGLMGMTGTTGLACWDLDENGACDAATEDTDGDGACTTADCRGSTGQTGVVDVLSFESFIASLPLGGTVQRQCRTEAHTAGPDEVALINMHASAQGPPGDAGNFLIASIGVSSDGGSTFPPADRGNDHMAIYTGSGLAAIAHTSASHRVDLVEGVTYVFGWVLGGGSSTAGVTCSGIAMITRLPP